MLRRQVSAVAALLMAVIIAGAFVAATAEDNNTQCANFANTQCSLLTIAPPCAEDPNASLFLNVTSKPADVHPNRVNMGNLVAKENPAVTDCAVPNRVAFAFMKRKRIFFPLKMMMT